MGHRYANGASRFCDQLRALRQPAPHRCQSVSAGYSVGVATTTKTRRRWFGAVCLVSAILMLVAGETILHERLSGVGLIVYWLGCLVLTALAAMTALVDAARVREEQRQEQRALIENTLRQIEQEKRSRENTVD